jgi:hypothetical protein
LKGISFLPSGHNAFVTNKEYRKLAQKLEAFLENYPNFLTT